MSTGWLRLLLVLALGACYANALCIQPNAGQFGRRRLASGHMPRAGVVTAGIRLAGLKLERRPTFTVGQRVRVQRNIVFKHLPKLKDGFDAVGCEGTVIRTYDNAQISADRPIKVEFTEPCNWVAHFDPMELAAIGDPMAE